MIKSALAVKYSASAASVSPILSVQRDFKKGFYGSSKGKNETKKSQNTYFFVKKVREMLDKSNKYAKL